MTTTTELHAPGDHYVLDNAWEQGRRRLTLLEQTFDAGTIRRLQAIGIRPGWRCLEAGAGAGSIARWLCSHVGPDGRVLAADLDTRFLVQLEEPNLDVHCPMKGVRVDPLARTATAGPGVIWRELDRETQQFGLVTPGGTVSDTGIAGLTLGGGIGWLSRRFGLSSDNLISADLITADGSLLHVSDREHPELMWGLRGGGGNFGIVTSFTYQLHELSGPMLAGPMIYSADRADELLRFARDWSDHTPEAMSVLIMLGTAPPAPFMPPELHTRPMVMIQPVWSGPVAEGERELASLRAFRPPVVDLVAPIPYTVLQQSMDPMALRGRQYYLKVAFLSEWDDVAIGAARHYQALSTSPFSGIGFSPMGGAISRMDPDNTAFAYRQASWACDIVGSWPSPSENPAPGSDQQWPDCRRRYHWRGPSGTRRGSRSWP